MTTQQHLEALDAIVPPSDPNDADTFSSLRNSVRSHVSAATAQPKSHADLSVQIRAAMDYGDRIMTECAHRDVKFPADVAHKESALRAAKENKRAYSQMNDALKTACGTTCSDNTIDHPDPRSR